MINKIEPGDRQLSASSWNEMRDSINNITPGQDTLLTGNKNPFLVTIKNVTGSALDSLSIVALSSSTYTRSDEIFANKAVEFGTELNGVTPARETDNIAVVQGACPAGGFIKGIADGCTPCFVYKDVNKSYEYAKPIASQTGYLKGTDDPTNIRILWIASGTGKKEAYVCIDATGSGEDNRDYFIINYGNDGTNTANNDPTVYTAGSLHYITWVNDHWEPAYCNEGTPSTTPVPRPSGTKLVVCQEDAPTGTSKECKLHYYTPESNYGVRPDKVGIVSIDGVTRCGVTPGEHAFSGLCFDYALYGDTYIYEPVFTAYVQADGPTGGTGPLYVLIDNKRFLCYAPVVTSLLSGPSCADIYPYDWITVSFRCDNYDATALDFCRDYPEGTIMPWYRPAPWSTNYGAGRGWVPYVPTGGGIGEISAVNIDKTSSHYNTAGDCIYVEAGVNDKIAVKEGLLCFIIKVKTNAIV